MSHLRSRRLPLSAGHAVVSFFIALFAGGFGAVLGIGGGLFIIPSLTLFLGIPLKNAIAASIVAVIATSLAGGNVYLRQHIANVRLGLLLALATAPSAVVGAYLATQVPARVLAAIFAVVLAASAYRMFAARARNAPTEPEESQAPTSHFEAEYFEASTGRTIRYRLTNLKWGVAASSIAGLISGLLGVGGGIVQVPVMNLVMHAPLKVATTTSTYIIGITAAAGAFVYYSHRPSYVDPGIAVPVTIGVFIGASIGSNILGRVSQPLLRSLFTVVLALYAVQMVLRVFGIGG